MGRYSRCQFQEPTNGASANKLSSRHDKVVRVDNLCLSSMAVHGSTTREKVSENELRVVRVALSP